MCGSVQGQWLADEGFYVDIMAGACACGAGARAGDEAGAGALCRPALAWKKRRVLALGLRQGQGSGLGHEQGERRVPFELYKCRLGMLGGMPARSTDCLHSPAALF